MVRSHGGTGRCCPGGVACVSCWWRSSCWRRWGLGGCASVTARLERAGADQFAARGRGGRTSLESAMSCYAVYVRTVQRKDEFSVAVRQAGLSAADDPGDDARCRRRRRGLCRQHPARRRHRHGGRCRERRDARALFQIRFSPCCSPSAARTQFVRRSRVSAAAAMRRPSRSGQSAPPVATPVAYVPPPAPEPQLSEADRTMLMRN